MTHYEYGQATVVMGYCFLRARLRPGLRRGLTTAGTTVLPSSAAAAASAEETTAQSAGSGEVAETTTAPVRTIGCVIFNYSSFYRD